MKLVFVLLFMGVQVSAKDKKYYGHYKVAQRAQVLNLITDKIEHTSYTVIHSPHTKGKKGFFLSNM